MELYPNKFTKLILQARGNAQPPPNMGVPLLDWRDIGRDCPQLPRTGKRCVVALRAALRRKVRDPAALRRKII